MDLEREGRILLNDYVGWGWDTDSRFYAIADEDGEPVTKLVHKFSENPMEMLDFMLTTGHFKPQVKAVAIALEAWRHPELEEIKQRGLIDGIMRDWVASGREPVEPERVERVLEEIYPLIVANSPAGDSKYRIETKVVIMAAKDGSRAFLSVDRDSDRVTVYASDKDEQMVSEMYDVLDKFFGPKE